MSNGTWCIIPLKEPDQAKSRLSAILAPRQRRTLFFLMAGRVIRAAREADSIRGVAVVTPSAEVARFAEAEGAEVIFDSAQAGTAAACREGIRQLRAIDRLLILPGDLPLVQAADLTQMTDCAAQIVLVTDRRGVGTNALLLTPPGIIEPAFGPGSAMRHAEAAWRGGASLERLDIPRLRLDIDDLPDLQRLRAQSAALDPELRAFLTETDLPPSDG